MTNDLQGLLNAIASDTAKRRICVDVAAENTGLQPWQAVRINVLTEDEGLAEAEKTIWALAEETDLSMHNVGIDTDLRGDLYRLVEKALALGYRTGFEDAQVVTQHTASRDVATPQSMNVGTRS